jgi:hypothetical protein
MENLKDEELSSLWTDDNNMEKKLNQIDFSKYNYVSKNNIREFSEKGFTIIKNAISHEAINNLLKITDSNEIKNNTKIFTSYGRNVENITKLLILLRFSLILNL